MDTQRTAGPDGIRYASGRTASALDAVVSGMVFRLISNGIDSLTDREISELDFSEGEAYITVEGTESVLDGFAKRQIEAKRLAYVTSF